jgi:hypothetical protein
MSRNSYCPAIQLHKALLFCLLLVPFCAANDFKYEETRHDARDFVSGGTVHVRLKVGDVRIRRGGTGQIRLQYTVKSSREQNVKDVTVDFDVHGNDANIEFHAPHGDNTQFSVEVEVPQNTNLDLHEKVGDITVEKIEGDKDMEVGVGDIRIAKGGEVYRVVNASTGIGDVHSEGYGESSGFLGKTVKYHGDGKYELRARVGVGDIHLDGK